MYQGQELDHLFTVTKGNQPNLLGRNLLNVLLIDWHSIFTNSFVSYVEDKHMDLNKILEELRRFSVQIYRS